MQSFIFLIKENSLYAFPILKIQRGNDFLRTEVNANNRALR